jgi:uncharacterized protein involved in cysteine biosynthesis
MANKFNIKNFFIGFKIPFEGMRFIKANPALKKFCIWPIIISIFVLILLFIGLSIIFGSIVEYFAGLVPNEWWWKILAITLIISGVVLSFFIAMFLFSTIMEIIIAPFAEHLSEKTEDIISKTRELKGVKKRGFSKQLANDISSIFKRLLFILLINLKNLLWNLIPVAGPFIYYIISIRDNLTLLGMEFFDLPMAKRMDTMSQKWAFVKMNRSLFMGAGVMNAVMLLLPILKVILMPFSYIGATLSVIPIWDSCYQHKDLTK